MSSDGSGPPASERLRRVIVGLATESEIYNRRLNPRLRRLYSNPDVEEVKGLYEQLIVSDNHQDREVALWLRLATEQRFVRVDVEDIIKELQEMEFILLNLMRRVDEAAQTDLNNWMNHIINTGHSIRDGFWMDAKIDMNMALHNSRKESVERVKLNPHFRYEVGLLQEETSRLFKQLRDIPVTLNLPEERLDIILEIQGVLLDLMGKVYFEPIEGQDESFGYITQRLNAALRYVLRTDIQLEQAKKEIELASSYLEEKAKEVLDDETSILTKETQKRLRALSALNSS